MNASDLKLDIFRKLDSLKGNQLEEAYGILLNFINNKSDTDEWQKLSPEQQEAIQLGIDQLDNGEGISHNDVMTNARKLYPNES